MSLFNSKKINTDPMPWRYWPPYGGEVREIRYASQLDGFRDPRAAGPIQYAPRPEFDNDPNPFLLEFRANIVNVSLENKHHFAGLRCSILGDTLEDHFRGPIRLTDQTVEYIVHARKVLSKYAAIIRG